MTDTVDSVASVVEPIVALMATAPGQVLARKISTEDLAGELKERPRLTG